MRSSPCTRSGWHSILLLAQFLIRAISSLVQCAWKILTYHFCMTLLIPLYGHKYSHALLFYHKSRRLFQVVSFSIGTVLESLHWFMQWSVWSQYISWQCSLLPWKLSVGSRPMLKFAATVNSYNWPVVCSTFNDSCYNWFQHAVILESTNIGSKSNDRC